MLDDKSLVLSKEQFSQLKDNLIFMKNICEEYFESYGNINHYTIKAIDGKRHDIVRPILWDMILEKVASVLHSENNIIQFSCDKNELYDQEFGKRIYQKILFALLFGVIALIINFIVIFIIKNF